MSRITRREFVTRTALAPLVLGSTRLEARQPAGGNRFDIVVAGAGHNSLVSAAYLAKAGYRCVVLEDQPIVGGGAKTAELTRPGFKHDVFATNHGGIPGGPVMRDLELAKYGLSYIVADPVMHISFPDGNYLTVWRDFERTAKEFDRINPKDGAAFRRIAAELEEVRGVIDSPERLAQHPKGNIWRRRMAMSAYDMACDLFEDVHCRAFSLAAGHLRGDPPGDPGTYRQALSVVTSGRNGRPTPAGGSGALTEALARYINDHGGAVLTRKTVKRLIIENGRCAGVECADGSSYRAGKAVLSTVHVKHLLNMAPRELWPDDYVQNIRMFKPEHAMFNVHFAVTEPPKYPVADGTLSPHESVALVSPDRMLKLEFEKENGRVVTDDLPMHIVSPCVVDPSRAPAGMHVLKINGFQSYELKEGPQHWDRVKNEIADAYLATLRKLAPNLTDDKILARYVISPLDMERLNPHFWKGSAHSGYDGAGQTDDMRPVPGWSEYRMPIPGLYQTGACTKQGGSVNGYSGRNAVAAMLKDFGGSIEDLAKKAG